MKASSFSDAQKAFILKQAEEGVPIGDVCRKAGISQATFYSWRKRCAGMTLPKPSPAPDGRFEQLFEAMRRATMPAPLVKDCHRANGHPAAH